MIKLRKDIIETAVWLRERNSPCGYDDFYNVLRKKIPDQSLNRIDWKRVMRLMRMDNVNKVGVFLPKEQVGDGVFIINNSLYERIKNG